MSYWDDQKEEAILHGAANIQETKASDLYTLLANISAKRRVVLRILLCCGGEVEETERARGRRCFDSEARTYFTSTMARTAPPRQFDEKEQIRAAEAMKRQWKESQ